MYEKMAQTRHRVDSAGTKHAFFFLYRNSNNERMHHMMDFRG